MTLNFDQLREANVGRCEEVFHGLNEWSPTDWATALAGECGELCDLIKKLRRIYEAATPEQLAQSTFAEDIADEIADTVIYADLLAARLGLNLGQAIVKKFNEVSDKSDSSFKLGTPSDFQELFDWRSDDMQQSAEDGTIAWYEIYPFPSFEEPQCVIVNYHYHSDNDPITDVQTVEDFIRETREWKMEADLEEEEAI